jgi:hypothetical protein
MAEGRDTPIDYEALAKQFGGSTTVPNVDYEALAKQFGGTTAAPPAAVSEGMPGQRTQKDPYAIGSAALGGAVAGFATPEITMGLGKVMSAVPYPPVKAAGYALQAGAPFMSTVAGRVMPSIYGALGGAGGETTKQELEIAGVRPSVAKLAGMGVEFAAQPLGDLVTGAAKVLSRVGNVGQALTSVLKEKGLDINALSSAETKIIADQVAKLRGEGPDAAASLYAELEKGAGRIVSEAGKTAAARRVQAEQEHLDTLTSTGKVPTEADRLTAGAQSRVHDIGNADTELTDIGARQRKAISDQFSEEKLARDQNYKDLKAERDAAVSARENNNDYISGLPYYKQLRNKLDAVLLEGKIPSKVGTAPETEKSTLSAYNEIKAAMSPREMEVSPAQAAQQAANGANIKKVGDKFIRVFEPSFNAIDTVRRKLGDAAFGQGEEGFKAIGQARAKEWYGYLSDLQSKYAGQAQDELQGGYELASGLLERFKGGPGAKVLKTEKLAPDMFTKDTKDVPAAFFKSRDGVAQLSAITKDPALVEQTASDYVARNLKDKSADAAEQWLRSNSDFLSSPELKNVLQKSVDYVDQLRAVEGQTKGMVAGAKAQESVSEQTFKTGLSEANKIAEQGRKTSESILGSKFPEKRVNALLNSTDKTEWENVANALKLSTEGRGLLSRSLEQHLANIAEREPSSFKAIDALNEIAEPLLSTGLADKAYLDGLRAQLNKIRQPETMKLNWLKTQLMRGISATGGAMAGAVTGNALAPENQNALAGQ